MREKLGYRIAIWLWRGFFRGYLKAFYSVNTELCRDALGLMKPRKVVCVATPYQVIWRNEISFAIAPKNGISVDAIVKILKQYLFLSDNSFLNMICNYVYSLIVRLISRIHI